MITIGDISVPAGYEYKDLKPTQKAYVDGMLYMLNGVLRAINNYPEDIDESIPLFMTARRQISADVGEQVQRYADAEIEYIIAELLQSE